MPVLQDLRSICAEILEAERSLHEWAKRESDDEFQRGPYVGGFDATEMAFCFSYCPGDGSELWFQLSLDDVRAVAEGRTTEIQARPAE